MPRILIVDDSPTIRKMVRASLRALESFDFVEAANGLEAIEQVALGPVALMILDLNMPDMHGVDVLEVPAPASGLARRAGRRAHHARRRLAAARPRSPPARPQYLTKPFVPQALLSTARELLGEASAA